MSSSGTRLATLGVRLGAGPLGRAHLLPNALNYLYPSPRSAVVPFTGGGLKPLGVDDEGRFDTRRTGWPALKYGVRRRNARCGRRGDESPVPLMNGAWRNLRERGEGSGWHPGYAARRLAVTTPGTPTPRRSRMRSSLRARRRPGDGWALVRADRGRARSCRSNEAAHRARAFDRADPGRFPTEWRLDWSTRGRVR